MARESLYKLDQTPYSAVQIRRGIRDFLQGQLVSGVLGLAVALLLVRYMSIREYAAYIALTSVQMILMPLANLGLDRVVARYVPEWRVRHSADKLFRSIWILLAIRLAGFLFFSGLIALFADALALWLDVQSYKHIFITVWLYAFFFALSIHVRNTLQSLMQQRVIRNSYNWEWLPKIALIILFVVWYQQLSAAIALWINTATLGLGVMIMLYGLLRHRSELRHRRPTDAQEEPQNYKKIARFSLQNYFYLLISLPSSTPSIRMVAAVYLPTVELAAYGFYQTFSSIIQRYLPLQLMIGIIEPVIMGKYAQQKDFKLLNNMVSSVYKFNLFLLTPVVVWLAITGEYLVPLITGGKYAEYHWLLVIFVISLILGSHTLIIQMVTNAVERSALLLRSSILSSLVFCFFMAIVIAFPAHALFTLAALSLIQPMVSNTYIIRALRSEQHPYHVDWKGIIKILALALVVGLVAKLIADKFFVWSAPLYVIGFGLINAVLFFVIAVWLRPFQQIERDTLQRVMGKFKFPW